MQKYWAYLRGFWLCFGFDVASIDKEIRFLSSFTVFFEISKIGRGGRGCLQAISIFFSVKVVSDVLSII